MRDLQLDNYRGLAMLYILCVPHVMYWLQNGGEPLLSLILMVIPVVFFISGAAMSVSNSRHGLLDTIVNRLKRIVVPFYLYACVTLLVVTVANWLIPGIERLGFRPFSIAEYGWKDVLSILLCENIPGIPYMAHLWFIPLYLILSCTFPLQAKVINRVNKHVYMAVCVVLFVLAQAFTQVSMLRELLCYNVFLVAGYLYYRKCKPRMAVGAAAVALAMLVVYVLVLGGNFCPMQDHKFPPDWVYVTYNVMTLSLWALLLWKVRIPNDRILRFWNERGFNIYLYQSFVFAIVAAIRCRTYAFTAMPVVRVLLDMVLVFGLSMGLSMLTFPLERYVLRLFKRRPVTSS